ncbi:MAG: histidine kinase dimerization/phospho-acceptor domain-containing protein [Thermodesulfovibrionia bacterium]|nr:histidine kinase dimerization/phospho-acceptor domain-containing protein [Thermodesulfovibrionia bacterium]
MELLALLSNRDDVIIPEVKASLNGYTVYPLKTLDELEDLYTNIPINLILIDTFSYRLSSLNGFLSKLNEDVVVLIAPEKLDKFSMDNLPRSIYDCIDSKSIRTELPVIVERALERQRFKNELDLLRKSKNIIPLQEAIHNNSLLPPLNPPTSPFDKAGQRGIFKGGMGGFSEEKVLINFAKMLTVSFDMKKLFNHFMDSVMGIVRINKMSVMLRDEDGFYIKTCHGLDPYLADNFRLKKDSALVTWLAKTGRIMHKPVNPVDTASINIMSEMELLQCSFSFPMIHKGKLIGIFNIDNKITEEPFYKEELEMLYVLCNYLAAAVKDINLYHQIWYQKEFTKNILSSMNSGVIAIDKDEKITIFNQQASEILNLDPLKVIGSDLRNLPSPLGDILYETMVTGASYKRYEVEVGAAKIPLGINSCRLMDKNQNPVGAGIVFTDLSEHRKLEEQKRRTEKLEAINSLMAKIAHEVRTPLTSIQTYTQIISEKYKRDEELQNFFTTTVIQSIHKLDSIIDKLVIFSSSSDYNFNKENANLVFDEAAGYISRNIPEDYKFLNQGVDGSVFINVDKKLLIKAIYYLVLCIIGRAEKGTFITMSGRTIMQDPPRIEISIKYNGQEIPDEEKENLLKPLLDINNLGSELNMPISHKIIEGHNGSIDIKSADNSNAYIIMLPTLDRRSALNPLEEKHISG